MPAQLPIQLCIVLLSVYLSYRLLTSFQQRLQQQQHRRQLTLQVSRVSRHGTIIKLWLRHPTAKLLPKARAGQHLLVTAQDQQGKSVSRAYSLLQDCSQRRYYQLAIKAEPNGRLSQTMFQLQTGDMLLCSWPKGSFGLRRPWLSALRSWLGLNAQRPVVLVAAGIGITPLLAMLKNALRQGRPVQLWLQARTEEDLKLWPLLRRLPGLKFEPVLTQAKATWQGRRGRIDAKLLLAHASHSAEFYLCANPHMVNELSQQLRAAGARYCYSELFKAAQSTNNHMIELAAIKAQSFGYSSVLDALLAAGAQVPYDCRGGSCGQCRLLLKSGYCKTVLAPEFAVAEQEILSCCVQAESPLELALPVQSDIDTKARLTVNDLKHTALQIRD